MKNKKCWLAAVAILILGPVLQTSWAQSARKVTKADLDRRAGEKGRKQPGSVLSVRGQAAVAQFRDRLEFHQLPVGTSFDAGTGQLKMESGLIKPAQLEPAKVLWFDYPFDAQAAGDHLLVCTNLTRKKLEAAASAISAE